jgi:hypothetical protein
MPRKDSEGTGGRGGAGQYPAELSPDDFVVADESSGITELDRTRSAPSELQPLVDKARKNLGKKIARSSLVPVEENGQPVYELDEVGEVRLDEEGNPVPKMQRVERAYSYEEAEHFAAGLRNVANRNKLPAKGYSLRIVSQPPLSKAKTMEPKPEGILVQFYVIRTRPSQTPEPATTS